MKLQIISLLLFCTIAAFPSIGTSTGVMRHKIMLKMKSVHQNTRKIPNRKKVMSMKRFLISLRAANYA